MGRARIDRFGTFARDLTSARLAAWSAVLVWGGLMIVSGGFVLVGADAGTLHAFRRADE